MTGLFRAIRVSAPTFRNIATPAALLALLGACSHGIQIAEHADDYNVSVETAENKMFLRNIIRGAKGYPMYFTQITSFTSNLDSSFSLTPDFRIGANGASEDPLAGLSLNTSSKPQVAHKVLQSKEFFQGIYTPVEPDTLNLFLHHGWPEELVLNVFIEEIEVHQVDPPKGEKSFLCRIENNPVNAEDVFSFAMFLNLAKDRLSPKTKKTFSAFGLNVDRSELKKGEPLKFLKDTELSLLPVKSNGELFEEHEKKGSDFKNPKQFRLFLVKSTDQYDIAVRKFLLTKIFRGLEQYQEAYVTKNPGRKGNCPLASVEKYIKNSKDEKQSGEEYTEFEARIRLRSPQSMIYYLGQLAHVDIGRLADEATEGGKTVKDAKVNQDFTVSNKLETPAAVSILFGPTLYSVAEDDYKTMQMITLVRQVFSLRSSSDKAPESPQSVRLITD